MSTRSPQPAESFDSTSKLMFEALAKASAELEKSVTSFTEQLISFNESIQKSLEEELLAINGRLEACIKSNLDELAHSKHILVKRLVEAERQEAESLVGTGRSVRQSLTTHALEVEKRIEDFMDDQVTALKEFLQDPERQIKDLTGESSHKLTETQESGEAEIQSRRDDVKRALSDKVAELERVIKEETAKARDKIVSASDRCQNQLNSQRESICAEVGKFTGESLSDINSCSDRGTQSIKSVEEREKAALIEVGDTWKQQINNNVESFNKLLSKLSAVVKENYETKLSNVSDRAREEITNLSDQAHEKISVTRGELEVELRELEREYVHHFEDTLRKLETMVSGIANDKRNSGVARQHKAQKLRDQMHAHLKRFGAELIDSVKDASQEFESEFTRATDGFHTRIEGARVSAIELLERESRLMQKDIERTMREFEREVADLESQLGQIEKAGQDAAFTVIACRKAVLSFRGE